MPANHPLYNRWAGMHTRCNPGNKRARADYYDRGIRVCEEWCGLPDGLLNFIAFADEHLGPCPDGHSLDRIDNDDGYRPGNVRWADRFTQSRNRRPYKITDEGRRRMAEGGRKHRPSEHRAAA